MNTLSLSFARPWLTMSLALGLAGSVDAQTQSIRWSSFKGTHNSYDLPVSLEVQIRDYNTWAVELDVCWGDDRWQVKHPDVYPSCGTEHSLDGLLAELHQATVSHPVFLWLDVKNNAGCCSLPSGWFTSLKNAVLARIPANEIYGRADLEANADVWPSMDEIWGALGKRFIVIVDENNNKPLDDLFFVSAKSLAEASNNWPWARFINKENGDLDVPGENVLTDSRFLWRAYGLDDAAEYDLALAREFQLVYTDHYSASFSFDRKTHPPVPFYFDPTSQFPLAQYGTTLFPFESLWVLDPVDWIRPGQDVILKDGSYDVFPGWQLVKPMVMTIETPGMTARIHS